MGPSNWTIADMPSYGSRRPEEIDVLWSSDLPAHRDDQPVRVSILQVSASELTTQSDSQLTSTLSHEHTLQALWDSLIGFFEDAIVLSCSRPGSLVVTPVRDPQDTLPVKEQQLLFLSRPLTLSFHASIALIAHNYQNKERTSEATETQRARAVSWNACYHGIVQTW